MSNASVFTQPLKARRRYELPISGTRNSAGDTKTQHAIDAAQALEYRFYRSNIAWLTIPSIEPRLHRHHQSKAMRDTSAHTVSLEETSAHAAFASSGMLPAGFLCDVTTTVQTLLWHALRQPSHAVTKLLDSATAHHSNLFERLQGKCEIHIGTLPQSSRDGKSERTSHARRRNAIARGDSSPRVFLTGKHNIGRDFGHQGCQEPVICMHDLQLFITSQ